jgi:ribosomal protein S18 acetylase RimI-like enzyme
MSASPRRAGPEDADALARLAARTFPLACPAHTPPEAIAAHIATELSPARFREHMATAEFYVVDGEDGEVVGYTMLAFDLPPIDVHWQRPLEVKRIYVDADAHGSGLATALMDHALHRARSGRHDWIWLGTNEENARAIRFYEKCGFRIVGRRTFRVADSVESDYVLAQRVSDGKLPGASAGDRQAGH